MDVGIGLTPVSGLSGLLNPVQVTSARDATGRLFVVEQGGRVLVRRPDGSVGVLLDISETAANPAHRRVVSGGELGLVGLAFHPGFATNGRFYLHHSRLGLTNTNDVVEYRILPGNADVADPESERVVLRVPQPFANHFGGSIEFGPDGLLYIAKGDGGGANDPLNHAQNVDSLLGKILRIDVDRDSFPADPLRNYGIPSDNPFVNAPGADEIFATGLRNPYRFSFDRGTGLLYAGDVGQAQREEINIVTIGGNYGWRPFEGTIPTPGIDPNEGAAIRPFALSPAIELGHGVARSITGGYVYRGVAGTLPEGSYLFGDYITGNLFLLRDGVVVNLPNAGFNIAGFGEDDAGELYVVRYFGNPGGEVYKVVPTSTNRPPDLAPVADQTFPAGQDTLVVPLSATDADGDPLTYTATARSLALDLDMRLGLRTDGGNMWENWGGRGERWLLGRRDEWYFILPDGRLFLWDGGPGAEGTLIDTPGALYHQRPELLYNAQAAFDLDLGRGLRTDGNMWENWGGRGERWLLGRRDEWYFILPDGRLFLWDGGPGAEGTLIATPGAGFHAHIRLLHEGDRGQALATSSFVGPQLTIDLDDVFRTGLVVTVTAGDGDRTDSDIFVVRTSHS